MHTSIRMYADMYVYMYACMYVCMQHICICHRHENRVRKEMKRFGAFIVFGILVRMPADAQTNVGGSGVHAQWFSHWKIRADNHDFI